MNVYDRVIYAEIVLSVSLSIAPSQRRFNSAKVHLSGWLGTLPEHCSVTASGWVELDHHSFCSNCTNQMHSNLPEPTTNQISLFAQAYSSLSCECGSPFAFLPSSVSHHIVLWSKQHHHHQNVSPSHIRTETALPKQQQQQQKPHRHSNVCARSSTHTQTTKKDDDDDYGDVVAAAAAVAAPMRQLRVGSSSSTNPPSTEYYTTLRVQPRKYAHRHIQQTNPHQNELSEPAVARTKNGRKTRQRTNKTYTHSHTKKHIASARSEIPRIRNMQAYAGLAGWLAHRSRRSSDRRNTNTHAHTRACSNFPFHRHVASLCGRHARERCRHAQTDIPDVRFSCSFSRCSLARWLAGCYVFSERVYEPRGSCFGWLGRFQCGAGCDVVGDDCATQS